MLLFHVKDAEQGRGWAGLKDKRKTKGMRILLDFLEFCATIFSGWQLFYKEDFRQ